MPHLTYILYSPSRKAFYKGRTTDMDKRMRYHNGGHEKHTAKGVPWTLLWRTEKPTAKHAIHLERKLKNLTRIRLLRFILNYPDDIPDEHTRLLVQQLLQNERNRKN